MSILFSSASDSSTIKGLPLFLQGASAVASSGTIDIYIAGSTSGTNYQYNNMTLFLEGDKMTTSMNMFVEGYPNPVDQDAFMNMYIQGNGTYVSNSLQFITFGGAGGGMPETDTLPMFIEGSGISEHFVPNDSNMNLYISGDSFSTNSLNLFIQADTPSQTIVDMYISGILGSSSGSVNLYMLSKDSQNQSLDLFIRGYL